MVDARGGDVFLLLPCVLLDGGALEGCLSKGGLDLVAVDLLVERVLTEKGEMLSRTMLPIGGMSSL